MSNKQMPNVPFPEAIKRIWSYTPAKAAQKDKPKHQPEKHKSAK